MLKSVGMRFLKGAVSGALAVLAVYTIHTPSTWHELSTALIALISAVAVGFFTGGFMAVEKYYNWDVTQQ